MTFWRVARASLSPPSSRTRKIKGGPLIDLAALQQAIGSGGISENSVDVVNRSCDDELDKLEWNFQDVLDCLLCASARDDFKGSEWCDTSWAGCLPCDAYSIPYDEASKRRAPGALEFYLKFSLDEGNTLSVQMVRAHLSR
jgi:hypothetical protein